MPARRCRLGGERSREVGSLRAERFRKDNASPGRVELRGPVARTMRLFGHTAATSTCEICERHVGYAGSGPAALVRPGLPAVEIMVTGKHAAFVDSRWHQYDDGDWEKAHALLTRLGATHLAERTYGTLSAGEKQRVLIARSLMTSPASCCSTKRHRVSTSVHERNSSPRWKTWPPTSTALPSSW